MPAFETDPGSWNRLQSCAVLCHLSPAVLQELSAVAEERSFACGDALMTQGDRAEGLLILLEGTAYASLHADGGEDHRLGTFTAGDIVGEMALVTREPRTATVVAHTPVRALLVRTADFDRLAVRHLQLGMVLTELVADRLGRGQHDGLGGKIVEGFRILRCVGRGAMSVVYQARHEATGEIVALKMMSYRLIYDAVALLRFHHEAELAQTLEHQNITRLMRLFPAYHTYFLVMEFCEGVNLRELLRTTGPLPESQVRAILGQLASALDYIHGRGVVHRDLKPANVMVTGHGEVKLTDFGLAVPTNVPDADARTRDNVVIGTPAYMAPEQLSGGRCDFRADIYAFGCLAFELLTGRHLFTAMNFLEMEQQKHAFRLPPAERIGHGISTELADFLERALQVIPERRPSSLGPLVEWARPFDWSASRPSLDLGSTVAATQIEPVAPVGSDSIDTTKDRSSQS